MGIPRIKSDAQRRAEAKAKEMTISLPLTPRLMTTMQNRATREGVALGIIMARVVRAEAAHFATEAIRLDKIATYLEAHPEKLKLT
jgi:hypothetical protein